MGVSDIVHGVLDVAGFIPVVGAVADVANAAIYAAEGDWGNAALSAVSAIPVVGDAAGAAGISAKLAVKGSKLLENALWKANKMSSFMGMLMGKAKTGAKKILKKVSRKSKGRRAKRESKKVCSNGSCLTGDMLIESDKGLCPIKEIREGDDIYSRDMQTGESVLRKVLGVFHTQARTVYHIWLDDEEELKTTAYHPLFVKGKGWVNAIHLREGELLETIDGTAQVTKIQKTRHEEPVEVYNFHVEELESYFVSRKRVYVHNKDCAGKKRSASDEFQAPKVRRNEKGELTNGTYTISEQGMLRHTDGTRADKSQFLYRVDADKAVLDASAYADANNLWKNNKAKVKVTDGPVGILSDGHPTDYINVYRTKGGYVHGCPGNPPEYSGVLRFQRK